MFTTSSNFIGTKYYYCYFDTVLESVSPAWARSDIIFLITYKCLKFYLEMTRLI